MSGLAPEIVSVKPIGGGNEQRTHHRDRNRAWRSPPATPGEPDVLSTRVVSAGEISRADRPRALCRALGLHGRGSAQ